MVRKEVKGNWQMPVFEHRAFAFTAKPVPSRANRGMMKGGSILSTIKS
jgi:hypothetical protein